jgi:hypothetical protein
MNHRLLGIIGVALLILAISSNHAFSEPSGTSIDTILSARESHDGKEVSVVGKVSNLKLKTSKRGNACLEGRCSQTSQNDLQ